MILPVESIIKCADLLETTSPSGVCPIIFSMFFCGSTAFSLFSKEWRTVIPVTDIVQTFSFDKIANVLILFETNATFETTSLFSFVFLKDRE